MPISTNILIKMSKIDNSYQSMCKFNNENMINFKRPIPIRRDLVNYFHSINKDSTWLLRYLTHTKVYIQYNSNMVYLRSDAQWECLRKALNGPKQSGQRCFREICGWWMRNSIGLGEWEIMIRQLCVCSDRKWWLVIITMWTLGSVLPTLNINAQFYC